MAAGRRRPRVRRAAPRRRTPPPLAPTVVPVPSGSRTAGGTAGPMRRAGSDAAERRPAARSRRRERRSDRGSWLPSSGSAACLLESADALGVMLARVDAALVHQLSAQTPTMQRACAPDTVAMVAVNEGESCATVVTRLSASDSSFYHLEDTSTPMYVGSLSILRRPKGGLPYESLLTTVEQRLPQIPR